MKITADTNLLVRAIVRDDPRQSLMALETLESASCAAISLQSLCEFAWVLERRYRTDRADIAAAIRKLLDIRNVVADRPGAEAGLAVLDGGGDFADGVIAYEGRWLGGEIFVSFDKKAVRLLSRQGLPARLVS